MNISLPVGEDLKLSFQFKCFLFRLCLIYCQKLLARSCSHRQESYTFNRAVGVFLFLEHILTSSTHELHFPLCSVSPFGLLTVACLPHLLRSPPSHTCAETQSGKHTQETYAFDICTANISYCLIFMTGVFMCMNAFFLNIHGQEPLSVHVRNSSEITLKGYFIH